MADIELKEGEGKDVTLTLTDEDGNAADVSAVTTFTFAGKKKGASTAAFTIEDADIDQTDAATGTLVLAFSTTDTATPGDYDTELKADYGAGHVVKSDDLSLIIKRAIIA